MRKLASFQKRHVVYLLLLTAISLVTSGKYVTSIHRWFCILRKLILIWLLVWQNEVIMNPSIIVSVDNMSAILLDDAYWNSECENCTSFFMAEVFDYSICYHCIATLMLSVSAFVCLSVCSVEVPCSCFFTNKLHTESRVFALQRSQLISLVQGHIPTCYDSWYPCFVVISFMWHVMWISK